MTLLALLAVAGGGALVAGVGGVRDARIGRGAAVVGLLAIGVVLVLALALPATPPPDDPGFASTTDAGLFDGRLVPGGYLRLAIVLWAGGALLTAALAWLVAGHATARRLAAATLAAIAAGAVALAATHPAVAAVAAGGAGLAVLLLVLAGDRDATIPAAARELRVVLGTTVAAVAGIAVAPVAAAVVIAQATSGDVEGAAGASGAGPVLGLAALAIALGVAVRLGAIPFHLRVPRLSDVVPSVSLPLALAWAPLPLAAAGLAAIELLVAPADVPLDGERGIVLIVAALTLGAAGLAAFLQDDLRHATGYLVIADTGLVLVGLAAFSPDAWAPARAWLLVLAASKTALAAWAAAAEDRFATRSIGDLRGWMRRAPLLAVGLALAVVATFGLPGWVAFDTRGDLARAAAGSPWDGVLVLLGFATLPAYLRLLAIGMGPASSRVAAAAPERLAIERRRAGLVASGEPGGTAAVEAAAAGGAAPGPVVEGAPEAPAGDEPAPGPGGGGAPAAARSRTSRDAAASAVASLAGAAEAIRRNRAPTVSLVVLSLAVLAGLVSAGTIDVEGAAAQPAPAVAVQAGD